MKFTEYIAEQVFKPRLKQKSCLVVYDADRRFREICQSMTSDKTFVVDATESSLDSRQAALEALGKLGEPNSSHEELIVYVPAKRPIEDEDKLNDPFAIYESCGAVFPENPGDEYLQLCLKMKSDYTSEVRRLFAENPDPTFAMIDAIGGGINFPQPRAILKAESPRELLLALLAPSNNQSEALKNQLGWETEVRQLVESTLKYNLKTKAKTQSGIADELWRFILFSEFAFDLPQDLPAGLQSVPRASTEVRSGVSEENCSIARR